MNNELLKSELIHFEGYKTVVYMDTMGNPTVGIGHMDKHLIPGTICSASQIEAFYEQDVADAITTANKFIDMSTLDDCRQRVIVQLAYNMGYRLMQFVEFKIALVKQDWNGAAEQLVNSEWYGEIGERGPETCNAIINGKYSWE